MNLAFTLRMKKGEAIGMIIGLSLILALLIFWWIKWLTIKPIA
jgi:hypothetical protein